MRLFLTLSRLLSPSWSLWEIFPLSSSAHCLQKLAITANEKEKNKVPIIRDNYCSYVGTSVFGLFALNFFFFSKEEFRPDWTGLLLSYFFHSIIAGDPTLRPRSERS